MARKFTKPDYEATSKAPISLGEAIPANHLARFVVDIVARLDLSLIYQRYAATGGEAIAPEVLLALLFYGYATGKFSSRKIEKATYEDLGFRFVAGGLHPDHDTIANFRKTFLAELQGLFVQILLMAQLSGVLKVGNLSLDGSKIHADASKSKAVSYGRLKELETTLREEVASLFALGERADQGEVQLPEGLVIQDEIAFRKERLENLAKAKAVLDAHAQERYAMDNGYFSASNIVACEQRKLEPYIATGREAHSKGVDDLLDNLPDPPAADASPKEKMAYKLTLAIGKEIYRLRKCTVEPVIGIIKEILGFRQFSLRGLKNVAAEWCLVCLAFNLKRIHSIWLAQALY